MVLKLATKDAWSACVRANFDEFLLDHAANERKASAVAMSMIAHYPDKPLILETMADLALEELNHYRQVLKLILKRKLVPGPDEKDLYVNRLIKKIRRGPEEYFLDRLLMGGVIEARGAERFGILARDLGDPALQTFYQTLAESEAKHHELFVQLAETFFDKDSVSDRWQFWLETEATIMDELPIRARLH